MLPRSNPRLMFASAIFLLIACGLASAWMFYQIYRSEEWVRHTYAVQVLVGDIATGLSKTGPARQEYLRTGDTKYLSEIDETHTKILAEAGRLKTLVQDNIDERAASEELERIVQGRFRTLEQSLQLAKSGASTHEAQDAFNVDLASWLRQSAAIAGDMRENEARLLERRLLLTRSLFSWIVAIFAVTFALSLYMLWEHYRGLNSELRQRRVAERSAQNLSAQLLNAQDQERRRIARDLHDGLGQNLAAAKMIADTFVNRPPDKQSVQELGSILEDAVSSTRSISHLLHPPLVDEIGFIPAARSYVDGFSRRTGVSVTVDLPERDERLPLDLELTLFRVLQEALTNIQRHAKSTKAEVQFATNGTTATLKVRDYGVGLPPETLRNFLHNGTNVGVGLAGMKERVRERHGVFEIRSDSKGTIISATFPVPPSVAAPA